MSDPSASPVTTSTKPWWLPDRKVYAGGIAGVLAFAILSIARHFGYDLQPIADSIFGPGAINILAVLTGAFTAGVSYIIPPSERDIVNKLNNRIVALGLADPGVPVTPIGIAVEAKKVDAKAAAVDPNAGNFSDSQR